MLAQAQYLKASQEMTQSAKVEETLDSMDMVGVEASMREQQLR